MSNNPNLNLNKSRNPSSIANAQHNDDTGASRSGVGDILSIERIIPSAEHTAVAGVAIPNRATLRVANTTATWQFISLNEQGSVPGTVDATTAMALAPNSSQMVYTGVSQDVQKSLMIRTSAAGVQVILMKN
jgi:hypothetical protein